MGKINCTYGSVVAKEKQNQTEKYLQLQELT